MLELTERDYQLLKFLEKGFVADINIINDIFFGSYKPCSRRILKLYRHGLLNRGRKDSREVYLYYHNRFPEDPQHGLLRSKLFAQFATRKDIKITDYYLKYDLGIIKPSILLFIEIHQTVVAVLIDVKTRGAYQTKHLENVCANQQLWSRVIKKLRELKTIQDIYVVACAPKDTPTENYDHYYINPSNLKEDFNQMMEDIQSAFVPKEKV